MSTAERTLSERSQLRPETAPDGRRGWASYMMNIGLVAPEFPPSVGGMQAYAAGVARELARRGHAVTVFTMQNLPACDMPGVKVVNSLTGARADDLKVFDQYQFDVWHVMNAGYGWLANHKAPVVASVFGNDFLDPWFLSEPFKLFRRRPVRALLRLARLCGIQTSRVDRWGDQLTRRRSAKALARGFARVRHTFQCSRYSEAAFLARFPQCVGRTSLSYVGIGSDYLTAPLSPAPPPPPWRVITICRLASERKNVDVVLRAVSLLGDEVPLTYTVVGDGHLRPRLEALAAELGIADRVRFLGGVSDETMQRELAASHLFVLTSGASDRDIEGFGIVYLEANASGVPTLAARVGGATDAVEDGVSGWFVDEITPAAVASALSAFVRREVRFDAQACRKFAERFTWAKVVDHMLDHYPAPSTAERSS